MAILPSAVLQTTIPGDTIENEAGTQILLYGGSNVARVLIEILNQLGYEALPPIYLEHAGWEVIIWCKKRRTMMRVQDMGDGWTIVGAHDLSFWRFRKQNQASFGEMLERLNDAMRKDARFLKIGWFGYAEAFDATEDDPGSPYPVIPDIGQPARPR